MRSGRAPGSKPAQTRFTKRSARASPDGCDQCEEEEEEEEEARGRQRDKKEGEHLCFQKNQRRRQTSSRRDPYEAFERSHINEESYEFTSWVLASLLFK